ncbi:prephenate/arogenate dehydrogenase [Leptolyngbya sp. NK1-12]|uniref:Prephenate/arogenate dehydrogenase n=1 Tax=Leptolyngbya sp. NK1-12 TaxID=2547451 RepID=A0AA96WFZ0_9CYAN|nr:prephenate/arogenate dehydrogenase [Leptolyngbya sp. NK1-12]
MYIGIVGLGLIGGSLAIDLRQQGHRVLGVSRRAETCQQAIDQGIVDEASTDLGLMATAQVVFLCTPLAAMATTVDQLLPHLSPATILTDVGSVKALVVDWIAPRWSNFVGGHPMAGKAESGLDVAEAGLFVDRAYVLTPIETTPAAAVETVAALAQSLQCRVYYCQPETHDRAVAWISHLPVMVSASLIAACAQEPDLTVLTLAQKLASSGFRDTSRVGGGTPELGIMMARYNQAALLKTLSSYRQQLDQIIQEIEQNNWVALEQRLSFTQAERTKYEF